MIRFLFVNQVNEKFDESKANKNNENVQFQRRSNLFESMSFTGIFSKKKKRKSIFVYLGFPSSRFSIVSGSMVDRKDQL